MCRHLAYLGPAVALRTLLFGAPHSLCAQARTPLHQVSGRTNPDGWGVAWYADGETHPCRYRSATAIWDDDTFPFGEERAAAVVAAARLASPGTTFDECNNAPFADGLWVFSLNGFGFADGRADRLRAALTPPRRETLVGDSDSEVLFGLTLDRLADGATPDEALRAVTAAVDPGDDVRLNLLLSDGVDVAATAWGNSLFLHATPELVAVASEPLDDEPGWERVADRSIVTGSQPSGTRISPLAGSTSGGTP